MREILFRGKRMSDGEWVYGSFLLDGEAHRPFGKDHLPFSNCYIVPETDLENIDTVFNDGAYYLRTEGYHVIPDTVGQFTGLTANGKMIFEGDIVQYYGTYPLEVYIEKGHTKIRCFDTVTNSEYTELFFGYDEALGGCEVIGNIHDNPELLKGRSA